MPTLYEFPISHFCEKARWALDYKGIEYQKKTLIPGLHIQTARRLCGGSSVPILVQGDTRIQGSGEILTFLDETFPERPLTPADPELKREALEWEAFADEEIGVHVRRICYQVLLEHPNVVIPFFAHNGPWYGKPLLRLTYRQLVAKMRSFMNISAETAAASQDRLNRALGRIDEQRNGRDYLVGDGFTRADLTVAALLAPLFQPAGYGLDWPQQTPPDFAALTNRYADRLAWPQRLYRQYR